MTIARWTDERLDQLADDVDNLRGSVAELRATAEIMLQTQIQHQQNFEVVVSEIGDIKAEIQGLQLENRWILEEVHGIEPDNITLGEMSMTISMYQASVPSLIRSLNNLATILEKSAAHAEAKKIDPAVLINSRLYPDMFPLGRQVQIASDIARRGAARLAGLEAPKFEDNETTFPELIARLQKTTAYLETLTSAQIDGSEEKSITLPVGKDTMNFEGLPYLMYFVLPNVYFHVTTAYDILRHCGVELGKLDYLGKP